MRPLAALLVAAGLVAAEAPRPMALDDVLKIRNVTDVRLSPDGKTIAYVLTTPEPDEARHTPHIYTVGATRGRSYQLTNGKKGETSPRWSPDSRTIAFIADRGEEGPQVWLISTLGGEARRLTKLDASPTSLEWSPDGKSLAVIAHEPESKELKKRKKEKDDATVLERDLRGDHLHVIDVKTGKARQLAHGTTSAQSLSWSPDSKEIAVAVRKSPLLDDLFDVDLVVADVSTGATRPLVARPGLDAMPAWSPDGKTIAFISHGGKYDWIANTRVCLVPAAGGKPRTLTAGFDEMVPWWQENNLVWAPDGKSLYFVAEQRLSRHLFRADAEKGDTRAVSSGPFVLDRFSMSADGKRVAFVIDRPRRPSEAHVSPLDEFRPERRTNSNPHLDRVAFGQVKPVKWKGKDGLECQGLLILPVGYKEGTKCPLLTYVHGGPQGKHSLAFEPQLTTRVVVQAGPYPLHVLAGKGFAVFCPNPRGSGGFGEKFRVANVKDWGGGDFQDILLGIDSLIEQGVADRDRLGVMGWSYGGFMTGWAITHSTRFKAASAGAGVYNLTSMYGTTDIQKFMERYFGDPWSASALYAKRSSVLRAADARTPTLIQHGDADLRVPISQSHELYRALKKHKVPTEFAIYPRQTHLIAEPKLQADMMRRNVEWFERWLKPAR